MSNNREIRVGNTWIEGPGNGLGEVEFMKPGEPGSHFAKHVRARTCGQPLPLSALQVKPPLADQAEHLLVPLALQLC